MTSRGLLSARLRSHRLTAPATSIVAAARHMLAVQSQDLLAGRWALGVRTREATLDAADAAFARGDLVRAWTMRGTLHIVPAQDLAWLLSVTAGRQRKQAAARHRQLGIDDEVVGDAWRILEPRITDGGCTRADAFALLQAAGVEPGGQRGVHLLFALTVAGLICQGPLAGTGDLRRDQLFVSTASWIGDSARPDDPLAELFVRYIDGHAPAGLRDFAWWSGLTLATAREAAQRAAARVREVDEGQFAPLRAPRRSRGEATVFALPAFDEYYISYADRTPVCAVDRLDAVGPGRNGMVRPVLVSGGRVMGVWSHADSGRHAPARLFEPDADPEEAASAIARFTHFLGR